MTPHRHLPVLLAALLASAGCASTENVDLNQDASDDTEPGDAPPGDTGTDGSDPGEDGSTECTRTDRFCSSDLTQVLECDMDSGRARVVDACTGTQVCRDGACVDIECRAGLARCADPLTLEVCRGDGSGWDTVTCSGDTQCCETLGDCRHPDDCPMGIGDPVPCFLRIFIMLDASGSMLEHEKWADARTAINALMTHSSFSDMEVEFGFGTFAPPPPAGDCSRDGFTIHPVGPGVTASMVDAHFDAHDPRGSTPLVAAMSYMLTATEPNLRMSPPDPDYYNAIVLVSDGVDTCEPCTMGGTCTPEEFERQNAGNLEITARALRDYFHIRSYVIGFGDEISELELNAVAYYGGSTVTSYVPASDLTELIAAFDLIVEDMVHCNEPVFN